MKSKSSKALLISVLLHLGVGMLGFFYWFGTHPQRNADAINALFVIEEKPKVRRVTPPKRTQVRHRKTRDVSQPRLKILTSNQPASTRGVVSAAEPAPFQPFDTEDVGEPVGPTATHVEFENAPRVQRGVERPFKKEKKAETRFKSRLVRFIEAQAGPQRIVYCIDLSTSMQTLPPRKLKRVIDLMRNSLTFLEPHDSFNIVAFSTELSVYQNDGFLPVTAPTVAAASNYLADIHSQIHTKGTDHDMLSALTEIAKTAPTLVVLFSDGIPTTISGPDLTLVGEHAAGNGRIFAMGTGMAPNFPGAVMLRRLATVSEGDLWLVDRGRSR